MQDGLEQVFAPQGSNRILEQVFDVDNPVDNFDRTISAPGLHGA